MNHNFQISNCDTDSISFCKTDGSIFSLEERKSLVKEINNLSPEFMTWADDGYYSKVIILMAKNYILKAESGKITYKGSSLKDQKKEIGLKEFLHEIINAILEEKYNYKEIYEKYVKEIKNISDIKRWSSKRTISEKVMTSERTNETKIMDAIKGSEYKENDRIYVYFDKDSNLKLIENYNNDHDVNKLLEKLYNVSKVFIGKKREDIGILSKDTFLNYSLKKNQELLKELK